MGEEQAAALQQAAGNGEHEKQAAALQQAAGNGGHEKQAVALQQAAGNGEHEGYEKQAVALRQAAEYGDTRKNGRRSKAKEKKEAKRKDICWKVDSRGTYFGELL